MAATGFRSSSISTPTQRVAPATHRLAAQESSEAGRSESAPPMRQTSLDRFRAKVQPLVIARPATADEACDVATTATIRSTTITEATTTSYASGDGARPARPHPLEIWEINYDEIFPNSARLARDFASHKLRFAPCANKEDTTAAAIAPAPAPTAAIAAVEKAPVEACAAAPSTSSDSSIASPTSPPSITIPCAASRAGAMFADVSNAASHHHGDFGELRSRILGCPLGTPCLAPKSVPKDVATSPVAVPSPEESPDASAWDADDEEPGTSAGHWSRRARAGSAGRQWHGRMGGGGSQQERARRTSPFTGRPIATGCGAGARALVKRISEPAERSPREYPRHVHPDGHNGHVARPPHRLARSSSVTNDETNDVRQSPIVPRILQQQQQSLQKQEEYLKQQQQQRKQYEQQLLSLQRKLELSKIAGAKLARSRMFPTSSSVGSSAQQQAERVRFYGDLTESYLGLEVPVSSHTRFAPRKERIVANCETFMSGQPFLRVSSSFSEDENSPEKSGEFGHATGRCGGNKWRGYSSVPKIHEVHHSFGASPVAHPRGNYRVMSLC